MALVQDRSLYIAAAELFGDVHRFTLLRATLLIGALLEQCDTTDPAWRGSVHRHALLAIMMDTAVKLATVGCAASWMLELDRSPLFLMTFESLGAALERLERMTR